MTDSYANSKTTEKTISILRKLEAWSGEERGYPGDRSLGSLFGEEAERRGKAVAVVFEGRGVSYEELNRRANQMGRYLGKQGVKRGTRVGMCVERSVEMIEVILGIVKAGGVYVPLEGNYPAARLKYMVEDAGVEVMVMEEKMEGLVEWEGGRKVVLGKEREEIGRESEEELEDRCGGEDLAYIIYTSGSTGRPKGVSVCHRGVVRLVKNMDYVELGEEEIVLQFAPVSFDAATFEIWGALLNGGQLKVFPAYTPSVQELGEWLRRERVTTLWLTAGLFHQMVEGEMSGLRGVRQLLAGGEVLSGKHVRKFLREAGGVRLINGYGPTENTTFSVCAQVEGLGEGESVPIGRPVANSQVYVLDEEMERVGVGVVGELYLGGAGLARGYWGRAELTAEKFVPNPHGRKGGERLYRSGDLGRWREDGQLEFVGRKDEQVKMRGYRIELGEIAGVLEEVEWVEQAVVVMREEGEGEKRLVGYVVDRTGEGQGEGREGEGERERNEVGQRVRELREYAGQRLPEYMVPSSFVRLKELPLTVHGKVDRKKLPEPGEGRGEEGRGYEGPRTVTEELLAGIWAEVLRVERVGVDDNFFHLGGHSLLATQIISRVRETCRTSLSLRSIFEMPVLGDLARMIDATARKGQNYSVPPIVSVSRDRDLPLSFQQEWLWRFQNSSPEATTYNMPFAMLLRGQLDIHCLESALNEIFKRHEVLRTTLWMRNQFGFQRVEPVRPITLPVIDLSETVADHENHPALQTFALEKVSIPMDLSSEFPLKPYLARLAREKYLLFAVWHHIAQDAWSKRILVEELASLYNAFLNQGSSPLSDLTIQYGDYAAWQRSWLQGPVLEEHLRYWKGELRGANTDLHWPRELILQDQGPPGGDYVWFTFSLQLLRDLQKLGRKQDSTLFMVLLTAYVTLLHKYTGDPDISLGTDIAHRNRPEILGCIGFFLNTLVLRVVVDGDPEFCALLRKLRGITLEAYEHEDTPFEKVVDALAPSHGPAAQLFPVMFIFQSFSSARLNFTGLTAESLYFEGTSNASVKFDLELFMKEQEHGLNGGLGYKTEKFSRDIISMMIRHLQQLLEQVVADPGKRLSELALS